MTKERAYELQGIIAKEAIALLLIHGPSVDVTPYQKVVMLIGSVWGLPAASTQQRLDLISQEENAAAEPANPAETVHAMERKDLPINASGIETMDNIWGLFETADHVGRLLHSLPRHKRGGAAGERGSGRYPASGRPDQGGIPNVYSARSGTGSGAA